MLGRFHMWIDFTAKSAVYSVYWAPLLLAVLLVNWAPWVESVILRRMAERQLTIEFGTTDVTVGSVTLRFDRRWRVVCDIFDSRVGSDFLTVKQFRVTAANLSDFLTLPGMTRIPYLGLVVGFPVRRFECIEVEGCFLHIASEMKNM